MFSASSRAVVLLFVVVVTAAASPADVSLLRVPDDGIQPQALIDPAGTIHLVYYKGPASGGDLFYTRQARAGEEFSKAMPVNSGGGNAIAAGTIRGAQMALGRNGRVHVAWNGLAPKSGSHMDAPMLYTRLNDAGSAFEPERNLITTARGLDGGGSVVADAEGNVFVMWHAPKPGSTNGEAGRAVYVARSTDDGKTFAAEKAALSKPTGACGCCGMKAFADNRGNVFAFFRSAADSLNRDEVLLMSTNSGADFDIVYQHGWKVSMCPMSSAFISRNQEEILAAAETHGRVFFIRLNPKNGEISSPVSPDRKGKHPVIVSNAAGQILLAWVEGTSWGKGGTVAWQLHDKAGKPLEEVRRAEGVPAWSLIAAVARPDGSFAIIY